MKSILPKEAFVVAKAASDDACRPQLNGVHFRPDGSIEATNGHMLLRFTPNTDPESVEYPAKAVGVDNLADIPPAGVIVPTETCTDAAKALPKRQRMPVLNNVVMAECNGTVRLASTDLEKRSDHVAKPVDMPYPNTDQVFPKDDPTLVIGFDAHYLKTLAEAALAVNPSGEVRLEMHGPLKAMVARVVGDRGNLVGIVMPRHIS